MPRCPACAESRWVHPAYLALGRLTKSLTGWHPYACQACGWQGWSRSRADEHEGETPLLPLLRHRLALAVQRLRQMTRRWSADAKEAATALARLVQQHMAGVMERLTRGRHVTIPGFATWLIAGLVIGLVAIVVGVVSSRETPSSEPRQRSTDVALRAAPASPPGQTVPDPNVHRPAETPSTPGRTAVVPASEKSPIEPSPSPDVPVMRSPAPLATSGRADRGVKAKPNRSEYRGSLVITSDPAGAVVAVDGRVIGPTPVMLKDVRVGSRVVRIESTGYEPWSAAARVAADKETRVNATLHRGSQR